MKFKKVRCSVCGAKVDITGEKTTVVSGGGVLNCLSEGIKKFDATNCPVCHCQIILKQRLPSEKP